MNILITSGGTREYIDEVRVLTNISTGKLGAQIADFFRMSPKVENIFYLCSKNSILPKKDVTIINADSVSEVMAVMEKIVPKVDVVIHSMAISDFGFKPSPVKLKSNDPMLFIESLKDRIVVNPKIISFIKIWNKNVKLVGFKFEVDKSNEELIDIAFESLNKNDCDYVVANDKAEMKLKNEHVAYIIDKNKNIIKCESKLSIAMKLLEKLT